MKQAPAARLEALPGTRSARQARSHATQEAILEAALAAIREKGPDDFTLAEVVERARCTTGAVYGRFRDKEALLLALYAHLVDKWKRDLRRGFAAWDSGRRPLRADLRRLFAGQIAVRRKDWALRNAFLARIVSRKEFRTLSAELMRTSADLLAGALAGRRELAGVPEPDLVRRAGLVTVVVGASIERAITLRAEAADYLPQDDDALAVSLCEIAIAVLVS
jgi:AcrR family transcriptional regulator